MKALFIICPSLGIGEIYTSIKLGEKLLQEKNEIYYAGPSVIEQFSFIRSHKHTILTMEAKKNIVILDTIVEEQKPDVLIFTDYNMYLKNKYMNTVYDLTDLQKYHLPFYIIDTLGNCAFEDENTSLYEEKSSITVPPFTTGLLRPVPQHDPKFETKSKRLRYFSVFEKNADLTQEEIEEIRQKLNLTPGRETIVLTLGNWVRKVTSDAKFKLYLNLIRLVLHYLDSVGVPMEVIVLGECNFEYKEFHNLIVNKDLNDLSFDDTDKLLRVTSLLITLNRFSNSLCRAALYQIPCMVLLNSKDISLTGSNKYEQMEYAISNYVKKILRLIGIENEMVDKYTIFPEKGTEIFQLFFNQNPLFSDITPWYEIFDEEKVVDAMKQHIVLKDDSLKRKQKNFMEQAFLLETPSEILKELNYGICNPD